MTARLLVVGNSHLSAIRAALAEAQDRGDGPRVDTLALRGAMLETMAVEDGRLKATRDDTRAMLEALNPGPPPAPLADYDAVAVAGLDFKPLTALALWRGAQWPALPSLAEVEDLATMPPILISRPAAEATLTARLAACDAARLLRLIRPAVKGTLVVLPCPRLSQRGKWTDVPRYHGHGRAVDGGDGPELDALWERCARRACRELGARYLPQPRETIVGGMMTKRRFMRDEVVTLPTAAGPRKVTDMVHGNAAYGAAVLERLIRRTTGAAA